MTWSELYFGILRRINRTFCLDVAGWRRKGSQGQSHLGQMGRCQWHSEGEHEGSNNRFGMIIIALFECLLCVRHYYKHFTWSNSFYSLSNLCGGYHYYCCFAAEETAQGVKYWRAKIKGTEGEHRTRKVENTSLSHLDEYRESQPGHQATMLGFISSSLMFWKPKDLSFLEEAHCTVHKSILPSLHLWYSQGQTSVAIWIKNSLSKWWPKWFPNESSNIKHI